MLTIHGLLERYTNILIKIITKAKPKKYIPNNHHIILMAPTHTPGSRREGTFLPYGFYPDTRVAISHFRAGFLSAPDHPSYPLSIYLLTNSFIHSLCRS